ncbi:MAG: EAL domain-containing protein [Lachnospiraceae bacterium]|nr:EAL domain-containing protein [Lachnospiraceae bacterium]
MIWSLEYDISAFAVCLLFVIYYYIGKNLPIRRNRLFLGLLVVQLCFTLSDIVASVITSYPDVFSYEIIYAINIIYYVLLVVCPALFALFTLYAVYGDKVSDKRAFALMIPSIPFVLIALTTPLNHMIFAVDKNGDFVYEMMRPLPYYETLFYMCISSALAISNCKKVLRLRQKYVLLIYAVATMVCHTIQVYIMPYKQTVSLGVVIGITAIFLAFQNPDYYREKRTELYNLRGMQLYVNEEYYYGHHRPFLGFIITNFSYFEFADSEYYVYNVLRHVGRFLKNSFGKDVLFYFENGVFIIFLNESKDIIKCRDIIRNHFMKPFEFENGYISLEVSFFYADGDIVFKGYEDLKDTLHVAIEQSRQLSGEKTMQITEETHIEAERRLEVEMALKYALENDENLLVYYQPIFSNIEKKIVSAEALVRIYDPVHDKILMPDEFIYIAERNGCIMKLGMLVFEKTCKMIKEFDIARFGINNVEVNLSPRQCIYRGLAEELIEVMNRYRIDPNMIGLEITETDSSDKSNVYKNIEVLREYGIKFALDDYGTGYSNLVNILKVPFNVVKIDKSICWDYFRGGNNLLLEVIHQFHNRNKIIIVEGVEDKEMAEKLDELGVQFSQGFYYAKPLPLDDFIKFLKDYQKEYRKEQKEV